MREELAIIHTFFLMLFIPILFEKDLMWLIKSSYSRTYNFAKFKILLLIHFTRINSLNLCYIKHCAKAMKGPRTCLPHSKEHIYRERHIETPNHNTQQNEVNTIIKVKAKCNGNPANRAIDSLLWKL